jgi:hypothetical protein
MSDYDQNGRPSTIQVRLHKDKTTHLDADVAERFIERLYAAANQAQKKFLADAMYYALTGDTIK